MRALALLSLCALAACGGAATTEFVAVTAAPLSDALLSISGRSSRDVWAVGADHGSGPLVLHYDGSAWTRVATHSQGTLWWVHAFDDGVLYAAGEGSTILRFDGSAWEKMPTPGFAASTVYGVWGRSADDAYAVGSVSGSDGFVWHLEGGVWTALALPADLPGGATGPPGFYKVSGTDEDVWVVGTHGTILRAHLGGPFLRVEVAATQPLFTIDARASLVVAVGGSGLGVVLEGPPGGPFVEVTPDGAGLIQGVSLRPDGHALASGADGALFERSDGRWSRVQTSVAAGVQSLHAAWIDGDEGMWAVGGGVLSSALDGGMLIHRGDPVSAYAEP